MSTRTASIFLATLVGGLGMLVAAPSDIVINEIHYDPADKTKPAEFIELHNSGSTSVALTGWQFTKGVNFTFPALVLAPGEYAVVAQDPATLLTEYGVSSLGPWTGKLSNSGEKIVLSDAAGLTIDEVDYGVNFPWPTAANGEGPSMQLIHPSLDNNLSGSWRSFTGGSTAPQVTFLSAGDTAWRYRKGITYPADDSAGKAWYENGYDESTDGAWLTGQTPIGYGDGDDITVLNDMRYNYQSVFLRHEFTISAGQTIPDTLLLRAYFDDGCVVYINGYEVKRFSLQTGTIPFPPGDFAIDHERAWEEALLAAATSYLQLGTNTIAVQVINGTKGSSDLSIDLELKTPSPSTQVLAMPTPGTINSTYSTVAPPQIRQVDHFPEQPTSNEAVTVTAKVTDPEGVATVSLSYQIVTPGSYIRQSDAGYNAGWIELPMTDDGTGGDLIANDSTFTVTLPASLQVHRRLIRYRITATDTVNASIQVPYFDDPQPNFAYFCYDGVPDWQGANQPGTSATQTFSSGLLESIPVYHLVANGSDVNNCQWNGGSRNTQFEGSLIYDGKVYDHIKFNIRGQHSTYVTGKNKWRFRLNRGHYFQARDNYGKKYASKWKDIKVNGGTAPWTRPNRGMAGFDECGGYRLMELAGVPSSRTSYFHFRVIDDSSESNASNQYDGDFWGLYFSIEVPDGRFLDDRNLPDGNVYKLESPAVQDNQGENEPLGPADYDTLRGNLNTSKSQTWWRDNVDHVSYARYKAVAEALAHYDQRDENQGYYFHNPDTNKWVFMPWDLDTIYTPTHHYYTWDRFRHCLNPSYTTNYIEGQNEQREVLDLLFNPKAVDTLLNEFIDIVNPVGQNPTWADADQFMWNYHTRTTSDHRGYFNRLTGDANPGGASYSRTLISADHEGQMDFARKFLSTGGHGYDELVAAVTDTNIPNQPTITYTGTVGFPISNLRFETNTFSDPNGNGTFAAIEWRLGEISDPLAPNYTTSSAQPQEITAVWESGELTSFTSEIVIPPSVIATGSTYRARVRHKDNSGRWSHWSAPVKFSVSSPDLASYRNGLVVSEIMYKPTAGGDLEFIEIKNVGDVTLDLTPVSFTSGIQFNFANSSITSIAPGEYALVVKNKTAFEAVYGNSLPVAGETTSGLSNDGERITLSFGADDAIQDFVYNDVPPWPTDPDTSGASLILIHPEGLPDHNLAINWRSSLTSGNPAGNPGTSDTVPYTGGDLESYALASPPTITISPTGTPTLSYTLAAGADDVQVTPMWSTNLTDWSSTTPVFAERIFKADGSMTIRWILPNSSRGFVRLHMEER